MTRLVSILLVASALPTFGATKIKDILIDPAPRICGPAQCSVRTSSGWDCLDVAATTPITSLPSTLAAFPGCQGAGCYTRGGFTASAGTTTIYRVTSLASDNSAGSLGACLSASGPRVCIGAVGGTIHAPSGGYVISNPYIHVRLDTAPGQGINIDFDGVAGSVSSMLVNVKAHDVVLIGFRARHGQPYDSGGSGDALEVWGNSTRPTKNIVIDHVSAAWGSDEVFGIYPGSSPPVQNYPRDITLSYSLIGEGMSSYPSGEGSKCVMLGAYSATAAAAITNIDLHHNMFTNCFDRLPELRFDGDTRVVNNIIYNWGGDRASFQNGVWGDFNSNLARAGPNSTATQPFWVGYDDPNYVQTRKQSVFLSGNKRWGEVVKGWSSDIVSESSNGIFGAAERRASPLAPAISGPAIAVESADNLSSSVAGAGGAGHSRRLDCGGRWVTDGVRDSLDTRLVAEFFDPPVEYPGGAKTGCSGAACWPTSVAETPSGDYPVIATITTPCAANARDNTACVCADTDTDGMPDYWESAFCGSATGCSALATTIAAPWTNLEAFLSGLMPAP
jgi:pectate lyase